MGSLEFLVADIFEWMPPSGTALILCDPPYGTGQILKSTGGVPDLNDTDVQLPRRILDRLLGWGLPTVYFCEPDFLIRENNLPPPDKILFWKQSWISGFKAHSCFPRQVDILLAYNLRVCNPTRFNNKPVGNMLDDNKLCSPIHKSYVKRRSGLPVEKSWQLGKLLVTAFTYPGDRVVDACCGAGTLAYGAYLADTNVIGIDIEPAYIQRAEELW